MRNKFSNGFVNILRRKYNLYILFFTGEKRNTGPSTTKSGIKEFTIIRREYNCDQALCHKNRLKKPKLIFLASICVRRERFEASAFFVNYPWWRIRWKPKNRLFKTFCLLISQKKIFLLKIRLRLRHKMLLLFKVRVHFFLRN